MAYYDPLIAIWPNVPGSTTADKLAALNAMTAAGPYKDVSPSAIIGYLGLQGKLYNLISYANNPPTNAISTSVSVAKVLISILTMPSAPAFQTSQSAIYNTIVAMLSQLVADPLTGLVSADQTNLVALANTTIPWWQANGLLAPVNLNDLAAAGGLS